jgi:hypothetical protein
MFDSSYKERTVTNFLGAWTARESTDIPSDRAILAQNVRFEEGRVVTRYGFGPVFQPSNIVSHHWNWVYASPSTGPVNYLLWSTSDSNKVRWANLASPGTGTDVYTQAGMYAATFASAGGRAYAAHFGTDLLGNGHAKCLQNVAGTMVADSLFPRPVLITSEVVLSASFGAGGLCTPGAHRFAFILEHRGGAILRLGPAENTSALTLSPTSATATTVNKTATVTITPQGAYTWPADAVRVHLLMTTAAQPSRWIFVPGGTASVTAGGTTAPSFTVSISDGDLVQNGDSATDHLNLLTQSNAGAAPFSPVAVFEFGNRLGYIFNDSSYGQGVFFSQPNNFQAINAGTSIYYLPGQRLVTAAFQLSGVCYLLGPNWTYSTEDTGGDPVTWPGAKLVDKSIGTPTPLGVAVNESLGIAWVASKAGLYRFAGGQYDVLPVSWRNSDVWARINWGSPHTVRVCDDPVKKKVTVLAILSGDSTPSLLTWDYTNGTSVDAVNFTLNYIGLSASATSVGMVQNDTTGQLELWLGPGSTGQNFRREKNSSDAAPYRDDTSTGIQSAYRTGPMLGPDRPRLSHHHGIVIRVRGAGSLGLLAASQDQVLTSAPTAITLATAPGSEEGRVCDLIAEDATWYFSTDAAADSYFDISKIMHYSTPYAEQR